MAKNAKTAKGGNQRIRPRETAPSYYRDFELERDARALQNLPLRNTPLSVMVCTGT